MGEIGVWLGVIATAIGIIGSMAGAVAWVSQKNEKRMGNAIKDALTPLTYELRDLNNNLNDSKEDRKNMHIILDEHDDKLQDHEKRIYRLEDRRVN